MKNFFPAILLLLCVVSYSMAQDNKDIPVVSEKDKPVKSPWASAYLIDDQTSLVPVKNSLEFVIQHKFGTVANGASDLFGLYAAGSNIRLGLNYVPLKNLQIGWGITKKNMYNDFSAKWTIFEQTRKNKVPVSVTFLGTMAIDGRSNSYFKSLSYSHSASASSTSGKYSFRPADRLSYFSQLIIGRKFNDWLSLQAAASFTHFSLVDSTGNHDKIGAHFAGRIKISPQSSLIFCCDIPLNIQSISEQTDWIIPPKPNLACGLEIATTSHVFQIYVGSADGIIPQDQILFNQNDWTKKGLAVGFVITRLWNF
jgi:hypothetical protein